MWQVQTDRIIPSHKLDITIRHNDYVILVDRNVVKKEAINILKYKELTTKKKNSMFYLR
jgi:hypothetical protein